MFSIGRVWETTRGKENGEVMFDIWKVWGKIWEKENRKEMWKEIKSDWKIKYKKLKSINYFDILFQCHFIYLIFLFKD